MNNYFGMQDEVLEGMQQKLDDLLVEMNYLQQQYVKCDSYISSEREKDEIIGNKNIGDEDGSRCVCVQGQMLHPFLRRQRYNLFAYSFKKNREHVH